MLPTDWESCKVMLRQVSEDQLLDPRRNYYGLIDTLDGYSQYHQPPVEVKVRTVSFFIRRGGHLLYNGYLNDSPVVICPPSAHGGVWVYNQPHFSGQKEG